MRYTPAVVLATLLTACEVATTAPSATRPAFAATVVQNNDFTEVIDEFQVVPCANGGAGEEVHISGPLHLLMHVTISDGNGSVVSAHNDAQSMTGVGSVTDHVYRSTASGGFVHASQDPFPIAFTELVSVNLIGPGPDNNLTLHETFHITVDANGITTVTTFNRRLTCD